MLGRTSYSKDQVEACRARTARQLEALDKAKVPEALAAEMLANMVIALELAFVHRVRKAEGKDGNPLNEVRLIAFSLLEHDGVMTETPTIKYDTRKSITGLAIGAEMQRAVPNAGRHVCWQHAHMVAPRLLHQLRR